MVDLTIVGIIIIVLAINLFCFAVAAYFLKMAYQHLIKGYILKAVIFVAVAFGCVGVSFYLFGPMI